MTGLGTIINVTSILAGSCVGMVIGKYIPEKIRLSALSGVGLVTIILGIQDALQTQNIIYPLAAITLGVVIGEILKIEDSLEKLSNHWKKRTSQEQSTFFEGFITASLIFCIGPLAILGSISDGLGKGPQELIVKAFLDGIVALTLASTLGSGVCLSAIPVGIYEGGLTLAAAIVGNFLSSSMIVEMTATGGVLIIGIGLRLLDLKDIRLASFLPSLAIAPLLVWLFAK